MLGEIISHYRIIRSLGAGGMGEVYLAEDITLGRQVALKLLPQAHTRDEERLRRFKQEAKSASALNHPNILTIHEFGTAEGRQFIASEFVEGETLRALLKRSRKMNPAEALKISIQIVSALAAAHEAGIVHRDIKPENIMVRRDGYVKVLDFGLAKLTETVEPQTDTTAQTISASPQTQTGIVFGTTHYMSPEQATGKSVDARSDIFSFGAVLYEMLSGQRAFQGSSVVEILAATLHQEPKPLPSSISPDLVKIVQRCLRKDPARRYQTMGDLKVALEDLREELHPRQRSIALNFRWILLLAILLIPGLLLLYKALRSKPPEQPLRATAITTLPGAEQSPSLSPDGNQVVFSWKGLKQDNQDIYVQIIGQGSPLQLTNDPLNDYNPVWSPDGKWIAFLRSQPPATTGFRKRELRLIAPLGGPERKLAEIGGQDFSPAGGSFLAWTANSTGLIVTDSTKEGKPDALFLISLETGEKKQLTNPQSPVIADTSPAVSPDGRSLIFLRRVSWGAGELHLVSLRNDLTPEPETKRLTPVSLRADYPAWMPDSREIIFSAKGALWRMDTRNQNSATILPYVGEDGIMPVISRASEKLSRLVYVRKMTDTNLWRIDIPGAPVRAISSSKEEYHCQFSPDGRRVAFTSMRSGDSELWISDPDGSNASQLTFTHAESTTWPHWSPDGQSIAFSSNGEGELDIYAISSAGGKPRRLTTHPAIDIQPSYSRDGKWIYFSSLRSGDFRIWKMPASGGEAIQVTQNQGRGAQESEDGSIYYHSVSMIASLWRLPPSGGDPVKILDGVHWFNLALCKNGAYYIDRLGAETRLQYLDFATGKSSTINQNLGDVTAGLTASPDCKTVLFTRVDSSADDLMLVENFR